MAEFWRQTGARKMRSHLTMNLFPALILEEKGGNKSRGLQSRAGAALCFHSVAEFLSALLTLLQASSHHTDSRNVSRPLVGEQIIRSRWWLPPQWHSALGYHKGVSPASSAHPSLGSHGPALITPRGPCLCQEASSEKMVIRPCW